VWEPGRRLVFVDRRETEVDVRFEPQGEATRVTLEHRGLDRLPPDEAGSIVQYGWRRLAFQFEAHLQRVRAREE
jgi:Activator of Hsp90 ATPase homolog 1-like protein